MELNLTGYCSSPAYHRNSAHPSEIEQPLASRRPTPYPPPVAAPGKPLSNQGKWVGSKPGYSVLVIYTSAGHGHKKAAVSIHDALARRLPATNAKFVDILDQCHWPLRSIYRQLYRLLVLHAPRFYQFFYYRWETRSSRWIRWFRNTVEPFFCYPLQLEMMRNAPRLVVSTHFLPTTILGQFKRMGWWQGELWHVVTDYQAHGFHIHPEVDRYVVPANHVKETLAQWGVARSKIAVVGIPCSEEFNRVGSARLSETGSGVRRILFNANGIPFRKIKQIVQDIARNQNVLLVVAGLRGTTRRRVVERLLSKTAAPHQVLGFVDYLPRLLARADLVVCKAGGLIVSENLAAGVPMAICHCYPGQEMYNRDFLIENKVAQWTSRGREIAALVNDRKKLAAMRRMAGQVSRPHGASLVAQMVAKQLETN